MARILVRVRSRQIVPGAFTGRVRVAEDDNVLLAGQQGPASVNEIEPRNPMVTPAVTVAAFTAETVTLKVTSTSVKSSGGANDQIS